MARRQRQMCIRDSFWEKVILKKFGSTELFFEKWRSYCIENPTIDDEIIGSFRKLETTDWFAFIASQIEKSCLNLIENDYSKKINENYKLNIGIYLYQVK